MYKLQFSYHKFVFVQVKDAEVGPRGRLRSCTKLGGGAEAIENAREVVGCCGGRGKGGRPGRGGGGGKKGWAL